MSSSACRRARASRSTGEFSDVIALHRRRRPLSVTSGAVYIAGCRVRRLPRITAAMAPPPATRRAAHGTSGAFAASAAHDCPVRLVPLVCWMNIGRATAPVGSVVVSPVAIITQPFSSTALVKKSPRRRSCPVATHVVPDWHVPPVWITAPTASVGPKKEGEPLPMPKMLSSYSLTWPVRFWSGLTMPSYWYQTTDALPGLPTATHGQNTDAPGGLEVLGRVIVIGVVKAGWAALRSMVDNMIALLSAFDPPSLVSQTRYTTSFESMAIDGQCAKTVCAVGTSNC